MRHCGDRIVFIRDYLSAIFAEDVHAKRIDSLACATLGVMRSASLAVSVIGHARSGAMSAHQARHQTGRQTAQQSGHRRMGHVRSLDGRDGRPAPLDRRRDDQTTLALNLVTNHGRATPLLWLTVFKGELKDKRNDYDPT